MLPLEASRCVSKKSQISSCAPTASGQWNDRPLVKTLPQKLHQFGCHIADEGIALPRLHAIDPTGIRRIVDNVGDQLGQIIRRV